MSMSFRKEAGARSIGLRMGCGECLSSRRSRDLDPELAISLRKASADVARRTAATRSKQ